MNPWDQRGLIPGPEESEEAFLARASAAVPVGEPLVCKLFAFSIDWMPVIYSNEKLSFWEGGAMWEDRIQLRKGFEKGRFLGYDKEEVLQHEAVHVARLHFEEPRFEEILAYQTSKNRWRRYFGPLFRTPWESRFFLLSLTGAVLGYFFIPLIPLTYLLVRLTRDQAILKRLLKKCPLAMALRMTDKEIVRYSALPIQEIAADLSNASTPRRKLLQLWVRACP